MPPMSGAAGAAGAGSFLSAIPREICNFTGTPSLFICSGGVNPPGIKGFASGKTLGLAADKKAPRNSVPGAQNLGS